MLSVELHKNFGKFKLNVALEAENEVTGLLGASGCGKSMTLKCIAGIETPDSGRIVLGDRVLFDSEKGINLTPQERRVGYLFQQYALFPNMTVAQNIGTGVRKCPKAEKQKTVKKLLQSLYLEELEDKYPRQLSGGQQQRVALARILASEPEVLLLDEPFSALDSYLKWQVELELMDILAQFTGPVLFVTHSRDEIAHLCQHVCVLHKGHSEKKQHVQTLFDNPETLSACLLSGCKNISRATANADGSINAVDWGMNLHCERPLPEDLAYVGIRAHYVTLAQGEGENRLLCPVERVVEELFSTVVMLNTGGTHPDYAHLRIECSKQAWAEYREKEKVWVELPQDAIFLLKG